eukprot:m.65179 g.65179  ORF g.65179 m.65179 type:complete len:543 (+) comp23529_c1_seq2:75-1703(+)
MDEQMDQRKQACFAQLQMLQQQLHVSQTPLERTQLEQTISAIQHEIIAITQGNLNQNVARQISGGRMDLSPPLVPTIPPLSSDGEIVTMFQPFHPMIEDDLPMITTKLNQVAAMLQGSVELTPHQRTHLEVLYTNLNDRGLAIKALAPPTSPPQEFVMHPVAVNAQNSATFYLPPRYQSIRHIAAGSFGMVVAAHDQVTNTEVAIKKIRRPWETKIEARRAYRELKLLKYLQESWQSSAREISEPIQHENIVAMLDCFCHSDDLYIVMEHGGSDLQYVHTTQKVSTEHIKFFGYQILRAFIYLHSAGILHRDLKPSNIACTANCDLKILDFGLARLSNANDSRMTGYVQTRYYRGPEVIMQWEHYDQSLDMWSFGCILGELLLQNGQTHLFRGNDYVDQLSQISQLLGKPSREYINKIDAKASLWVETLPDSLVKRPFRDLPQFQGADEVGLDLLEKLLIYEPAQRLTAKQAIAHPFFEAFHDVDDEPEAAYKFDNSCESWDLTEEQWKNKCIEEIEMFQKMVQEQEVLRALAEQQEQQLGQ